MKRMTASTIAGLYMLVQSIFLYQLEFDPLLSVCTIPFVLFCAIAVPSSVFHMVDRHRQWMPRAGIRFTISLVTLIGCLILMRIAILAQDAPGARVTFFWANSCASFAVGFGLLDSLYARPLREFDYEPYKRHGRLLFALAAVHMMVVIALYPRMNIWYPVLQFDLVLIGFVWDLFIVVKERIYKLDYEPALTLMEFFEMYPEDGKGRE